MTIHPFEDDFGAEGLAPITGTEFFKTFANRSQADREAAAIQLVKEGNYIRWPMIAVPIGSGATIKVASDYFAVGTPDDYFYLPLSPITAQKIADLLNLSLPTTKIVRDTWKAAFQVQPQPMRNIWIAQKVDPDKRMVTIQGFADHNAQVAAALGTRNPAQLLSGTKKDVVLSNKIQPKTVAIYGWFDKNGQFVKAGNPIQGLNPSDHNNQYVDYSHGIRFIEPFVTISSGERLTLTDPRVASLVTDEPGGIKIARYNTGEAPQNPLPSNSDTQNVAFVTPVSESGAIGEVAAPKRGGGLGILAGLGAIGGVLWWKNRG